MTKGLKALKRIRQETCPATYMPDFDKNQCCDDIEKELKAFYIIVEKNVNMDLLTDVDTVEEYNEQMNWSYRRLTQEEFDLIKEASDHE